MNRSIAKVAVAATAFVVAGSAMAAAPDVTAVVTEITGMSAPVAALGGASLLLAIGIKLWKRLRGVA